MKKILIIGMLVAIMFMGTGCWDGVNYSDYAYKKSFGGVLKDQLDSPGIHFMGFNTYVKVNNQIQSYNINVDAASKDMQQITLDVNLNIQLKKEKSFEFIKNYASMDTYKNYIDSKVQEKAKTIIFRYQASDLLDKRLEISKEILKEIGLLEEIKYFEIKDIALKDIDFSEEYDKVIEKKAQLDIEKGIIEKQKANLELQTKNINSIDVDKYFKYQLIEKWDGKSSLIIGKFPE